MRRKMTSKFIFTVLAVGLNVFATPMLWANEDPITFSTVVERESVTVDDQGEIRKHYQKADKVLPGDTVRYTIVLKNNHAMSITDASVVTKIPRHLIYKEYFVKGENCLVEFSVDSGKSFRKRDRLMVKTLDGQLVRAGNSDLTHIKWIKPDSLAPGAIQELQFLAELK